VLGQLGNRVQHALRAFTPKDQKAVKAAAQTFRKNPSLSVERVITELGVGEALVSVLDEKGIPGVVERALIYPPRSRFAPLSAEERQRVMSQSAVYGFYEKIVDRESAYEKLTARAAQQAAGLGLPKQTAEPLQQQAGAVLDAMAKSAARAVGSQLGRQIIRGVLGSLFGGRRR
jgi:DNA helicase HerA-like ATPase